MPCSGIIGCLLGTLADLVVAALTILP